MTTTVLLQVCSIIVLIGSGCCDANDGYLIYPQRYPVAQPTPLPNVIPVEHHHEAPKQPYEFAYGVQDDIHGTAYSRQEASDGDRRTGEYQVELPDGRLQIVKYVADKDGYRAQVFYEGEAHYDDPEDHHHPPPAKSPKPAIIPVPVVTRVPVHPAVPVHNHLDGHGAVHHAVEGHALRHHGLQGHLPAQHGLQRNLPVHHGLGAELHHGFQEHAPVHHGFDGHSVAHHGFDITHHGTPVVGLSQHRGFLPQQSAAHHRFAPTAHLEHFETSHHVGNSHHLDHHSVITGPTPLPIIRNSVIPVNSLEHPGLIQVNTRFDHLGRHSIQPTYHQVAIPYYDDYTLELPYQPRHLPFITSHSLPTPGARQARFLPTPIPNALRRTQPDVRSAQLLKKKAKRTLFYSDVEQDRFSREAKFIDVTSRLPQKMQNA